MSQRVLGERRLAKELDPGGGAVLQPRHWSFRVGLEIEPREVIAVHRLADLALGAVAVRHRRQHHGVAERDLGDARAHGGHDAGGLMPEDGGERRDQQAVPTGQVGVTEADPDDAHEHLPGLGVGQLDLLDHEVLLGSARNGGFGSHGVCPLGRPREAGLGGGFVG